MVSIYMLIIVVCVGNYVFRSKVPECSVFYDLIIKQNIFYFFLPVGWALTFAQQPKGISPNNQSHSSSFVSTPEYFFCIMIQPSLQTQQERP